MRSRRPAAGRDGETAGYPPSRQGRLATAANRPSRNARCTMPLSPHRPRSGQSAPFRYPRRSSQPWRSRTWRGQGRWPCELGAILARRVSRSWGIGLSQNPRHALEPLDEGGRQMQASQEDEAEMRPERNEAGADRLVGLGRRRAEGDALQAQDEGAEGDQQADHQGKRKPRLARDRGSDHEEFAHEDAEG